MAFGQHSLKCVVFRVPADDYKHRHVMQLNCEAGTEAAQLKANNPDIRIESMEEFSINDPQFLIDKTAQIIVDGGPNYRPLQAGEFGLTVKAVQRLRAKAGGADVPGGIAIVDKAGNIVPAAARVAQQAAEIRNTLEPATVTATPPN